jgi:phosphopantothenoylcysteine decarboxylase / phosphopantothenate---cysteine ligase
MDLSGKRILLGVTGGIAAYKAVYLLREFQKKKAEVRVTMTPAATRFVGVETFSTLSRHEVAVEVFNDTSPGDSWTKHIHWGEWADLIVIAPCTANTLSKLVHGQADNMLTSVVLAARCPVLICPTMDAEMIHHPAVKKNLDLAVSYDFNILMPGEGYLASGIEGAGRLPEPEKILKKSEEVLNSRKQSGPLSKKKVLVTAGPTREYIDPVRYISNPSSGRMGIAMAMAAEDLGGDITLLHGQVTEKVPGSFTSYEFESADDLFNRIKEHRDADVVIMAAAVADFKPAQAKKQKVKKDKEVPELKLTSNPDSLAWLGKHKRNDQVLIGFAMETEKLEENAQQKLESKNLDWICANDLTGDQSGFEHESNQILLLGKEVKEEFRGEKKVIAKQILNRIFGK